MHDIRPAPPRDDGICGLLLLFNHNRLSYCQCAPRKALSSKYFSRV